MKNMNRLKTESNNETKKQRNTNNEEYEKNQSPKH